MTAPTRRARRRVRSAWREFTDRFEGHPMPLVAPVEGDQATKAAGPLAAGGRLLRARSPLLNDELTTSLWRQIGLGAVTGAVGRLDNWSAAKAEIRVLRIAHRPAAVLRPERT